MSKNFLYIILSVDLIWWRSIYGKIISGNFVENLGNILIKNSQNNPYSFYKQFLQSVAIPNSHIFANLTMWGEFLIAICLAVGPIYLLIKNPKDKLVLLLLKLGLIGGIFLNINFWLAFSSTSGASDNLNLLMILIEVIAVYTIHKSLSEK